MFYICLDNANPFMLAYPVPVSAGKLAENTYGDRWLIVANGPVHFILDGPYDKVDADEALVVVNAPENQ
jgi:hypothetical protein